MVTQHFLEVEKILLAKNLIKDICRERQSSLALRYSVKAGVLYPFISQISLTAMWMQQGKPNWLCRSAGIRARCLRRIVPVQVLEKKLLAISVRMMLRLAAWGIYAAWRVFLRTHNDILLYFSASLLAYTYIFTDIHTHSQIFTHIHTQSHTFTHIQTLSHIYTPIHTHTHTYTHT